MESVADDLLPFIKTSNIDMDKFQANLNLLLNTLSVNISVLSKVLNYDASYISRIRNGKRQPADPQEFACGISAFIAHHYQNLSRKKLLQILYTAVLTIWQIPFNFRKYCLNGLPMKHLP